MAQRKKEKQPRRIKSRIPEFKSREEEAKWFDTHDLGNFQDEFKPVKVRFSRNLSYGLTVQFDTATIEQLRVRAQQKGLGATQLVRLWVMERLASEHSAAK